ncbi:putative membrane protein YphA (DoxX/SURF4 family) [Arthrobacter sp. UYEF21]
MNQSRLTTTALTILRVALGFLFAAHGWQKFNEWTIAGTQAAFAQMGVPAASSPTRAATNWCCSLAPLPWPSP